MAKLEVLPGVVVLVVPLVEGFEVGRVWVPLVAMVMVVVSSAAERLWVERLNGGEVVGKELVRRRCDSTKSCAYLSYDIVESLYPHVGKFQVV